MHRNIKKDMLSFPLITHTCPNFMKETVGIKTSWNMVCKGLKGLYRRMTRIIILTHIFTPNIRFSEQAYINDESEDSIPEPPPLQKKYRYPWLVAHKGFF